MAVSGADIATYAQKFLGLPYVWGGTSLSSGADCSGFVQQVMAHFGINIPRVTYDQIGAGQAIDQQNLQAGDLIFFDFHPGAGRSGPDHVGMYIGNGKFIEEPRPGEGARISDLNSGYYQRAFVGGRRMGGIQGGGQLDATGSPMGQASASKLSPEELAAQYGWASGFLNSIPELKNIFGQAVAHTWSTDKFTAELRNTNWWKDNSASMREAAAMKATDPATWNANVSAMTTKIQQEAAAMGAAIPPNKLASLASQAVSTNMDDATLKNVLGGYVTFINGTLTGAAGMYEHNIRQYASDMGVSLTDQAIKNQAALIAKGLGTEEDFKAQLQQQASSMYPAYSDAIAGGATMKDIANPYVQIMSQSLGINPGTIGLNDPTIKAALNGSGPDGKPTGMSLNDFQTSIRSDPRWARTDQAQNSAMQTGRSILQSMGLIA